MNLAASLPRQVQRETKRGPAWRTARRRRGPRRL